VVAITKVGEQDRELYFSQQLTTTFAQCCSGLGIAVAMRFPAGLQPLAEGFRPCPDAVVAKG
jgi:hypothetical protein